jgi:hypothetical protein
LVSSFYLLLSLSLFLFKEFVAMHCSGVWFGRMVKLLSFLSISVLLNASQHSYAQTNGLHALYWNDRDFISNTIVESTVSTVNFDVTTWPNGTSPAVGIASDDFAGMISGHIKAPTTGNYKFHIACNDGARLWVGDISAISPSAWADRSGSGFFPSGNIPLVAGKRYAIRLFFYENTGDAVLKLEWTKPDGTREVIPNSALFTNVTSYTKPYYQYKVPFGSASHYCQPWKGYMETKRARDFRSGLGVVFNCDANDAPFVARHLAECGVRHSRFEVGWGSFTYADPNVLSTNSLNTLTARLNALKANGIRPVILLNGNDGGPCPRTTRNLTFAQNAAIGATQVTLTGSLSGLVLNYSGLNGDGAAARYLITGISGQTVTLSQPLITARTAGAAATISTLKYRPFYKLSDTTTQATLTGWKNYTKAIGTYAAQILGTTGQTDAGFDLEVWNELTFGSDFLNINKYYEPDLSGLEASFDMHSAIVEATAAAVRENPSVFGSTEVSDGFGNTIPWRVPSAEPSEVAGIGSHPYPGFRLQFPADQKRDSNGNLIPMVGIDGSTVTFIPTYQSSFPEGRVGAIGGVEVAMRMSPFPSRLNGRVTGRFTRFTGDPTSSWITETQFAPNNSVDFGDPSSNNDPNGLTRDRALHLKAKSTARFYPYFLNKGASCVDIYSCSPADYGLGQVSEAFYTEIDSTGAYPTDSRLAAVTAPALLTTKRMFDTMGNGAGGIETLRAVGVSNVTDTHNTRIFNGNGTAATPHFYCRDAMAILPFQVNPTKFVIPYYIMTRDLYVDLAELTYNVTFTGMDLRTASISVYDPITGNSYTPTKSNVTADQATLALKTMDYARLLIVNETP